MPDKLEKDIEKKVRRWVESSGGTWVKLLADGRKGIPDNLIMMPPVEIEKRKFPLHVIVELKRAHGGILSPHQERWLHDLATINQPVFVCYSLKHVQDVVAHTRQHIRRLVLGLRADLS